jgi:hypothetical protein
MRWSPVCGAHPRVRGCCALVVVVLCRNQIPNKRFKKNKIKVIYKIKKNKINKIKKIKVSFLFSSARMGLRPNQRL